MPRYFFTRVDGGVDPDPEGLELAGLSDARYEALVFAADTVKDPAYALWDGGEVRIEVSDETKKVLFAVIISAQDLTL